MTGSPVILAAWLVLGLTGFAFVITSYSIHYTKLYDDRCMRL